MRLEATLTREDLGHIVSDLAPVRIRLGDKGELHLADPSDVSLIAGRGLRVVCTAELSWAVLGFSVPITLKSLVLIVEPSIEERGDLQALIFRLHIESADIVGVPQVIGARATEFVRTSLAEKHVELAWSFSKTLSHTFAFPAMLENIASIALEVAGASLTVTSDTLVFGVVFGTRVGRRPGVSA